MALSEEELRQGMPVIALLIVIALAWTLLVEAGKLIAANSIFFGIVGFILLGIAVYWIAKYPDRKILREQQAAEEQARLLDERNAQIKANEPVVTAWKKYIEVAIENHAYSLLQEKKRLTIVDAYGKKDYSGWKNEGFNYFIEKILIPDAPRFMGFDFYAASAKYNFNNRSDWKGFAWSAIEAKLNEIQAIQNSEYSDIEGMTGVEYEEYCESVLTKSGWTVTGTPGSGDQGVDLIATSGNKRVCIQCKRYSKPVGNGAVQEVVAGMAHWNGTHAVVVSNAGFTKAAQKLAESTGVILVDDIELDNLEKRLDKS